jgi:Na+/melibiose symporter-like transporter
MSTQRSPSAPELPTVRALAYGVGQLPISVFFGVSSLLLMPFMTNALAIPAALAGTVILVPKFLAVLTDPAAGVVADRLPLRWKQRRVLLLGGGVLTSVSFYLLFAPPALGDPRGLAAYMAVTFAAANVALSALTVGYLMAAMEVAPAAQQRTFLMSWRTASHMGGVLLGGLSPVLVVRFGGGAPGYAAMGAALCACALVAALASYAGIRRVPFAETPSVGIAPRELFAALRRQTFFRELATLYAVKYLANGIQYAAKAYFVVYVLDASLPFLSVMVTTLTIAALLSQPAWVGLSRRAGKVRTLVISTIGMGCTFFGYALLGPGDQHAAIALSLLQGVCAGGGALMTSSLFLDSVEQYAAQTGERRPALLAGVWSSIEKAGFAVGIFALGVVLQWLGFTPSKGSFAVQPANAILGIRLGMAVLPAVGMVASLLLIARWKHSQHEQEALRSRG